MSAVSLMVLIGPIAALILFGLLSKGAGSLLVVLIPVLLLVTKGTSGSSMPAQEYPITREEEPMIAEESIFAQLPESFWFASGVGGWATTLSIASDGSFEGSYSDSEYSPDDDAMVVYYSSFYGWFENAVKIDDYTYSLSMASLDYYYSPGEEWKEDDVKYIATEAYGMAQSKDWYLYLPGHTTSDLTDECLSWIAMPLGISQDEMPDTLDCYVLYNINEGLAFTGEK